MQTQPTHATRVASPASSLRKLHRAAANSLARIFSVTAVTLLAATLAVPLAAQAQDKPPLKILVGFPPGGSADVIARIIGDAVRDDFSNVIIENKPGAAGRIALGAVKQAKPDGQTVIVLPSGPMVLFPHVYKKLEYDAVKDFTPVSQLARFQFGLVAGPAGKAGNLQQLIAEAKAAPGKLSYGTPGAGTLPHFLGSLLEATTGADLVHVPFQGGAPANTALLGGHIGYKFDVVSETAELHKAGKVRIIAVTGSQRDPQVPEVPTMKEQGINVDATAWFAMYAPAGLPPATLQKLESSMQKAVRRTDIRDKLSKLGYEPIGSNSAELAAAQAADLKRWEEPIKRTGVLLD